MRLRHIEVFNAIMLTGSVSAAARLINITQPAVSRTLQHAELQLGFPLFQRAKGRLTPTTEALTLYPHIERLFAQLDEVQRLAANLRAGSDTGELRILSVLALSYEVLPRALVRNGSVALNDLVDRPVIGLDSRDPLGTSLNQACRQAGVGFQQAVVTVQTYHAALSMAHHGLGVALVDGCTARSADGTKVDVLALEPHIPVPVRALRFAGKPDSVAVRGITRCMREAIEQAA